MRLHTGTSSQNQEREMCGFPCFLLKLPFCWVLVKDWRICRVLLHLISSLPETDEARINCLHLSHETEAFLGEIICPDHIVNFIVLDLNTVLCCVKVILWASTLATLKLQLYLQADSLCCQAKIQWIPMCCYSPAGIMRAVVSVMIVVKDRRHAGWGRSSKYLDIMWSSDVSWCLPSERVEGFIPQYYAFVYVHIHYFLREIRGIISLFYLISI